MQKTATIVHLDGLDSVVPLVGGYLKAYALRNPEVASNWKIELYSRPCRVKASLVIRDLVRRSPDLVAFSVYTWNSGLVSRLLPALRGLLRPTTRFLLGGVEIMNCAPRYVDPTWENVVVCNGEGERTFHDMLLELREERPDLERVGGVTFPIAGEWCTTPGQPRIDDLSQLASPWLSGVLDDLPPTEVTLFETNRGCPFSCEFCFWGGATGQKVYRMDLGRLKDELTFIAKRGVGTLSICDANFGILPRDIDVAKHIVAVSQAHGGPNRIVFNSSKVRPDRVEEISQVFSEAKLMTRHVFSLQSMDEGVLRTAKRTSLAREPYRKIQQRLNARHMSSMVEILWPMPGETLTSFKNGLDDLCAMGTQTFLVYPLIWLNNTGYRERTDEYGVTTLPEADLAGGAEIVIKTEEVSFDEYIEGLQFVLALYFLHDCRGLYTTLQLLNSVGIARFQDVLTEFGRWMNEEAVGPVADLWRTHLECFEDMAKVHARGVLANGILNTERQEFDRLLVAFVATQTRWFDHEHGDLIRSAVEHDLACRPYIFLQTEFELGVSLQSSELLETRPRFYRVRTSYDFPRIVQRLRTGQGLDPADLVPGDFSIAIDHKGFQLFQIQSRTADEHHWLCTLAVQEVARIEPRCTVEPFAQTALSSESA